MSYQVLLHGRRLGDDWTHVAVSLADGAWKLRMRFVVLLLEMVPVPHHQMARAVAGHAALSNVIHHGTRSHRTHRRSGIGRRGSRKPRALAPPWLSTVTVFRGWVTRRVLSDLPALVRNQPAPGAHALLSVPTVMFRREKCRDTSCAAGAPLRTAGSLPRENRPLDSARDFPGMTSGNA